MHTSDIAVNDPRYGPRRSRHGRGRYHSRRLVRDRRGLYNLLLRRPAQPPTGAHIVPFLRQKKRCSCVISLEAHRQPGKRKPNANIYVSVLILVANFCVPITIIHDLQFPTRREVPRDDFRASLEMQPLQVSDYEE